MTFTDGIVLSGVLIFLGGLVALGTQRAGQMGAPRWLTLSGAWLATLAIIGAVTFVVIGIYSLPGETSPTAAEALPDL